MDSTIGLLILGLVILVVFLWIGIRRNAKDRQLYQSLGEGLGLHPLSKLSRELSAQLTSAHRHTQSHSLYLRNVFSKSLPEGELYLFDLWESRSGYRGCIEQCAFAILSPRANLPRISLFPRSAAPGRPGSPLSPIATWAMSPMEREISLDYPGFEEHYLLTGKDENAVHAVMKPALVDDLLKSLPVTLRAQEQVFTISAIDLNTGQKKPDLETVRVLYNLAIRIGSILFG